MADTTALSSFLTRSRKSRLRPAILGILWLALAAIPGQAQTRYRLTFPEAADNYVEVEARYATGGGEQLELFLPVWTPGDYQLQHYAQRVDQLYATGSDGLPLRLQALSDSRWSVECSGYGEISLRYRVKGEDGLSNCRNYVDSEKAVLQGAATFISPVKPLDPAFEVEVELPPGWETIQTGLPRIPDRAEGHFWASNFDRLVDCPIVAGSPEHQEFRVAGVRHVLVYLSHSEGPPWDRRQAVEDLQKVVEATSRLWGVFPFAQEAPKGYWFLSLQDGGGGLEHGNSSCLGWNSQYPGTRQAAYRKWLDLATHEYFHAWNGKNLRPVALGPFEYEAENYTPSLWIVEGLTHYYVDLLLARAGLCSETEYLDTLSARMERVEGRGTVSLTEASLKTWSSEPKKASYRDGGALVGFILDQQIRQATNDRASLDDVMREAYRQYSGEHGYTEDQFEAVASQVAGIDLGDFFRRYVHGTEPLDLTPALRYYGLRLRANSDLSARHHMGLATRTLTGRLAVDWLVPGSLAEQAGLENGDTLLEVEGVSFKTQSELESLLRRCRPDGTVELVVVRDGQRIPLRLTVGNRVESDPAATPGSRARWQTYLKG